MQFASFTTTRQFVGNTCVDLSIYVYIIYRLYAVDYLEVNFLSKRVALVNMLILSCYAMLAMPVKSCSKLCSPQQGGVCRYVLVVITLITWGALRLIHKHFSVCIAHGAWTINTIGQRDVSKLQLYNRNEIAASVVFTRQFLTPRAPSVIAHRA